MTDSADDCPVVYLALSPRSPSKRYQARAKLRLTVRVDWQAKRERF